MSMNKLIMSTLQPLNYPVYPIHYPGDLDTYVTFFQYNEGSALHADDKEQLTQYFYQVDVWTKNPTVYTSLVNQVKEALVSAGFTRRSAIDLYEKETRVYHKAMRFSFVQKSM